MPDTNSAEKDSTMSLATPRARKPSLLRASCSAVAGGDGAALALLTGALPSQARAASGSLTRSSKKQVCVWYL